MAFLLYVRFDADLFFFFSQLAERYGAEVASDILTRSKSNLQLDAMPALQHVGNDAMVRPSSAYLSAKYDTVDARPESAESTARLL